MGREENYGSGTFDWTRLLGEDVARTVDEERNGVLYQEVMVQKEGALKPLYQLFDSVAERVDWEDMQGEFCGFYGWFFSVALSYAETFFPRLKDVCEDVRGILLRNVYEAVKLIPVRCLIQEIHCLKERGELAGASPREEYRFYDECMLGDIAYVKEIWQKYPELLRLMLVKIDWTVRELPDSLPHLQGKPMDAAGYRRELVAGFVDAYRLVLENKREAEAFLRPLWQSGSRYVARHTQQYSMYLFTSLHPDFMKNTKERIHFLHVLRKAGTGLPPDDEGRELFWQELRDMINMDIPYFSCKGDSLSLAASDGTEIPRFFAASALEEGKRKFERLGEADLQRQMMLISYSLLMLGEGDDAHMGGESGASGRWG